VLNEYVAFARKFSVPPSVAYVLPALFEGAAKKVGMQPGTLLVEAVYYNAPLGQYLAECAAIVAAEDKKGS
jgi:hypothetical protein